MKDIKTILESSIDKDLNNQLDKIGKELGNIIFMNPDDIKFIVDKVMGLIIDNISDDDYNDLKKYLLEFLKRY